MRRIICGISSVNIISILFVLLFVSCSSKDEDKKDEKIGATVKIVTPHSAAMVDYLELNATTLFLKKEIVRTSFQGYIQSVSKNIGDIVKEGDELFLLKTKEANAISGSETGNKYSVPIKAKSNGVITKIFYHSGDFISEGEQIAEIANPGSLIVELNVPYQNNRQVKVGMRCKLFLPDGKILNGSIAKSLPSMDASSQTQTYLINCSMPEILPENLNLTVKIPIHSVDNAIVVPKSAVLANEALTEFWIMKLTGDNTAIKISVKKGIENDSLVQITDPKLSSSDKIIYDGGYGLSDTSKVSIER